MVFLLLQMFLVVLVNLTLLFKYLVRTADHKLTINLFVLLFVFYIQTGRFYVIFNLLYFLILLFVSNNLTLGDLFRLIVTSDPNFAWKCQNCSISFAGFNGFDLITFFSERWNRDAFRFWNVWSKQSKLAVLILTPPIQLAFSFWSLFYQTKFIPEFLEFNSLSNAKHFTEILVISLHYSFSSDLSILNKIRAITKTDSLKPSWHFFRIPLYDRFTIQSFKCQKVRAACLNCNNVCLFLQLSNFKLIFISIVMINSIN